MDIERLSESERRLYALARAGTPLAEIGVRLGLPVPEVDRRLDLLVTRLELPDRLALREPLPDPEPAEEVDDPAIDFVIPGTPGQGRPRTLSRRSLLIAAGAAAGVAAAGGTAAFFLARDGSSDPAPGSEEPTPTGTSATASLAPTLPALASLDLIEPVDGAYERRTFAPGEEIPWKHGIFFMRTPSGKPDLAAGEVEAYRLAQRLEDELLFTYRLPGPRYIEMLTPDQAVRILVDRETGDAWSYPAELLRLAAVRPHAPSPASSERLLFEELDGAEGAPARPTGLYFVSDQGLTERARFHVVPPRFGPDPLLSSTADRAVTVHFADGAYSLRLFDLSDGGELAALPLPRPEGPPNQPLSIRWIDEAPANIRNEFGVEVVASGEPSNSVKVLRAWLPWNGDWPAAVAADWDSPRSVFFDPGGSIQLIQRSLREVPAQSLGGGENWPAVEIANRDGQAKARIKSASLIYGDEGGAPSWRFAGEWFFTMTAYSATEGPGYDRVGYTAWNSSTLDSFQLEIPPPPGNQWYHRNQYRGPIPHPRNPGVIALGRFEAARLAFDRDSPNSRLTDHVVANVTSTSGPDHLDPWSGNPNELVFALAHGGHDGGFPGAMIAPKVEEPPFDDRLRFLVARAGDCLNLRAAPALNAEVRVCIPDGTELTIWPDARGGPQDGVAFVRNEDGAWVAVALNGGAANGGALGWVSAAYLDWA